jgi:hypothetical protein
LWLLAKTATGDKHQQNPKSEIRNPKEIRNAKAESGQPPQVICLSIINYHFSISNFQLAYFGLPDHHVLPDRAFGGAVSSMPIGNRCSLSSL